MSGVSIATGVIATDALGGGVGRGLQSPGILAQAQPNNPITGTLTETTLATITVPGNTLGVNGRLRITATYTYTNSANNKTLRVKYGGTTFQSGIFTTTAGITYVTDIWNVNSQSVQLSINSNSGSGNAGGAVVNGAIDTTISQNILLTAQLANTGETITLIAYTVEAINP